MKNVLILGATGQIAQQAIPMLAQQSDVTLTLFARNKRKLEGHAPQQAKLVQGNVLNRDELAAAMQGQDMVYANLTGDDLDVQAQAVISAMQAANVKRLIFVLALGIYDEVPGKFGTWNNANIGGELKPFRRAADAIEASGLDYTILRPAWLTDEDEVDYETTAKGQPFKGTVVSRKSVADLVARTVAQPAQHIGANLGINKPGSDGDKPYFM